MLEGFGYRVLRWQSNGQPDAGFGAGGSAVIVVSNGSYLYGRAPSIATSGAGAIYAGFDFFTAVTRVLPDGGRTAGVTRALAIGYYNAALGHYFMTANPEEQRLLDTGAFPGWQRYGPIWTVAASGSGQSVLSPVCRYYGRPEAGLDSHFYSASPFECSEVERLFAASWQKESDDVYEVYLPNPATGACAPRSRPIYRYFNGRVDANHLFTPTPLPFVPQGWVIEGYGPLPLPVAMCAPIL